MSKQRSCLGRKVPKQPDKICMIGFWVKLAKYSKHTRPAIFVVIAATNLGRLNIVWLFTPLSLFYLVVRHYHFFPHYSAACCISFNSDCPLWHWLSVALTITINRWWGWLLPLPTHYSYVELLVFITWPITEIFRQLHFIVINITTQH